MRLHPKSAIWILVLIGLLAISFLVQKVAHAGAQGGAKSASETVLSGHGDVYNIVFVADEPAKIGIKSDGGDVDLYVYDEGKNLIVKDNQPGVYSYVEWTPTHTGTFTIRVVNREDRTVAYRIVTN